MPGCLSYSGSSWRLVPGAKTLALPMPSFSFGTFRPEDGRRPDEHDPRARHSGEIRNPALLRYYRSLTIKCTVTVFLDVNYMVVGEKAG